MSVKLEKKSVNKCAGLSDYYDCEPAIITRIGGGINNK